MTERISAARKRPKAMIMGIEGAALSEAEKQFFSYHQPYGYILFARNCISPEQIQALTNELREVAQTNELPILIDQEGGRVARLGPPHWRKYPAAKRYAELLAVDAQAATRGAYLHTRLIASDLHALGITVDCAPVADVPVAGSHDIIGDRAYGTNPQNVATLARAAADGLMDGAVIPVVKHIPGHGRALVDSHEDLPVVSADLKELEANDFEAFRLLADLPMAMTAHVVYEALDAVNPATLSSTVIEVIRKRIGFDGLLMSDDLSMKALKGDFAALTQGALDAGCDVVLHCNGKMAEMEPIAKAAGLMSDKALARAQQAWERIKAPKTFDIVRAEQEWSGLMAQDRLSA